MTEEQNLLQRKRVQITAHPLIRRKRGCGEEEEADKEGEA